MKSETFGYVGNDFSFASNLSGLKPSSPAGTKSSIVKILQILQQEYCFKVASYNFGVNTVYIYFNNKLISKTKAEWVTECVKFHTCLGIDVVGVLEGEVE